MRNKKIKNGFTFIELLATIGILGLVIGITSYFIISIINNSKEETNKIALNNIKTSARYYVEENPDKTIWKQETNETETYYTSCIPINLLINTGYLKKDKLNTNYNHVLIKKGNNESIISETFDDTYCQNNSAYIKKPTTEYCKSGLKYIGIEQTLTITPTVYKNDNSTEQLYNFENAQRTNAGDYKVTATLNDGYLWEDGTKTSTEITCKIAKATPLIEIDPDGSNTNLIKNIEAHFTSHDVDGTITLKSSNEKYATATAEKYTVTKEEKLPITITPLATRNTTTTITITFTPNDKDNYTPSTTTFTLGNIEKKFIDKPTAEDCTNPTYDKTTKTLVKDDNPDGYTFYDFKQIDAGEYNVTAKLKYGYAWKDNTSTNVIITCKINKATPTLELDKSNGTIQKNESTTINVTSNVSGTINISSNTNYISITSNNPAPITANTNLPITLKSIETSSEIIPVTISLTPSDLKNYNIPDSITYYVTSQNNIYTLTYNSNGGNSCNPNTKSIVAEQAYGTLCTPTRSNYVFTGWYTAASGGTKVTTNTKAPNNNVTIYAHWKIITAPTLTINVYKRTEDETKTGNAVATITANNAGPTKIKKSTVFTNHVNGWLNKKNYPYGVYLEIIATDEFGISKGVWQWNDKNLNKTNGLASTYIDSSTDTFSGKSGTTHRSLSGQGYRKAKYTLTNIYGKSVYIEFEIGIDRTPPTTQNPNTKSENFNNGCFQNLDCNTKSNTYTGDRNCAFVKTQACGGHESTNKDSISGIGKREFKVILQGCRSQSGKITTTGKNWISSEEAQKKEDELNTNCNSRLTSIRSTDNAGNVGGIYKYSILNQHTDPGYRNTKYFKINDNYEWVTK